jgi:hypothetical protein
LEPTLRRSLAGNIHGHSAENGGRLHGSTGTLVESRLYEVINNITEAQHLFGTHVLWFRNETLMKIPPNLQKIVFDS